MSSFSFYRNRYFVYFGALLVFVSLFAAPLSSRVQAAEVPAVNVTLKVQGISTTIFDDTVAVTSLDGNPQTALDALKQGLDGASISYTFLDSDWGPFIYEIGGDTGGTFGGWDGWLYSVNNESPWVGAHDFKISENDQLLFYYGRWAAISSASSVTYGDVDPEVVVALVGDEFNENAAAEANWEINTGSSTLVLNEILKTDNQNLKILFTGTAAKGTLSIKAKSSSLVGDGDSNEILLVIGFDKSQLENAVTTAQNLLDQAEAGEGLGQYPQSAIDELTEVLAKGQAVLADDEALQEEIANVTDELSEAITRFQSLEIKGEATGLEKSIEDALAYYAQNKTLTSWWEMVALRGAGVNLQSSGWILPAWSSASLPADSPATTYAGLILGLKARGENPEEAWESRNLLSELAAKQQDAGSFGDGVNNTIWGIIALRSSDYPFEAEKAVNYLLSQQLKDGGYTFFGDTGDPDLTAMALVALSGYRNLPGVNTAIENALGFLASIQLDSGGFASWGTENANTIAAVLTGLVSVGENVFSARWVKNPSIYDALVSFQLQNGSFSFSMEPLSTNAMATSQALLALGDLDNGVPAYFRLDLQQDDEYPGGELPRTGGAGSLPFIMGFIAVAGTILTRFKKK